MGVGCMPSAFHWEAGGAGTARLRNMRARLRRTMNYGSFAILGMLRVVGGCLESECGIRCGLRQDVWAAVLGTGLAGASRFATYASAGIVLWSMGRWSLTPSRGGA